MTASTKPGKLAVRAYQVGFGDCLLLSFAYPDRERHVLVDFGSSGLPENAGAGLIKRVANDIADRCHGKLDAVVVSHRHLDHLSGFATSNNPKRPAPGDVIRSLRPAVVVQPWTEDPDAATDATKPTAILHRKLAFVAGLGAMQGFAESLLRELHLLRRTMGKRLADQLAFVGEQNLKNLPAVQNLMTMAQDTQAYVHFGSRSGLESVLPGVKVRVLGPPTVEQSDEIRRERDTDENEFWHLLGADGRAVATRGHGTFRRAASWPAGTVPRHARWFKRRLAAVRSDALLELVRALDEAMNNTSVILLFEAGGKKFLFPGDAQIENWAYALSRPDVCQQLRDVLLYKVGHHGSLNATPKSLWALFRNRSPSPRPGRLQTILSTKAGKHGSSQNKTEVPRKPLVHELQSQSDLFTTQSLSAKTLYRDFEFEL
ncbi:MAG: hypothetical protein HY905_02970 [Deltaproteobacteria bacterium]|nr:hypothetical protein [Deltaproteobacteria bacterium]